MSGYAHKITQLAWDPTSRFLATGGSEVVTVWDVSGKGPRGTTPTRLFGHTRKVTLLSWQRRGGLMVSGDTDGNAALWLPERSTEALRETWLDGAVCAAAWSPDDRAVAVGSATGGVVVWDVPASR